MNSKYIYTSYMKKLKTIDEFDMEKFILEVQKRECIWNVNSKSYNLKCVKNRDTKRRAWEEIGKIFNPDWDNLTTEERLKKVEALTKKWANVRKYYTDEVRKPANSPLKKRQRKYHHLLTFLDDSVNKRRVARIKEFKNISEEVNADSSSDSETGELFIAETEDETKYMPECGAAPAKPVLLDNKNAKPDPFDFDVNSEPAYFPLGNKVVAPVSKSQKHVSEMAKKNPHIMKLLNETRGPYPTSNYLYFPLSKPVEDTVLSTTIAINQTAEASKKFLLSLLPEIMSLSVKQNIEFRLGIVDLLNDIKMSVQPKLHPKLFQNINKN